ncbi:ATP-binding protein [Novosphingobium sp. RD2P27]|uniref:histidine kinase n=1 Tax=Novosphingobium kalidii TaxID=3230299 RepID=A0ABV2CX08_9SPHN
MDAPLLALTRRPFSRFPDVSARQASIENMRQLIQLRWLAVIGQLIAILAVHFLLRVELPLAPMIAIVGLLAFANFLFRLRVRRSWIVSGELVLALLLDMAALTAQLYLSGGATNPFISLYLVQVVLGAILLQAPLAWLLVASSCVCTAFLSIHYRPLVFPAEFSDDATVLLMSGSWISFVMVAVLLVLFSTRITRNLRARDAYAAELGQRAVEEDGIVRMGLFASGAAHELGTPLSTLAVLIADWQRHPVILGDKQFAEELEEAQAELGRCKQIVSNILHSAGRSRGEAMGSASAEALLESIAAEWRIVHPSVPLKHSFDWTGTPAVAAEPALRQAIWSLLDNAAEASPAGVLLLGEVIDDEFLMVTIADRGIGFSPQQLERIGALNQTTKNAGHGVGLFLAGTVARRLGGKLEASNRLGGGAEVRLTLPIVNSPASEER